MYITEPSFRTDSENSTNLMKKDIKKKNRKQTLRKTYEFKVSRSVQT